VPKIYSLRDFGPEFESLLTRADHTLCSGSEDYTIQFDSPKIAAQLRFRCYAYFKCLKNSAARPDLVAMCDSLSIRIAGSALVFYRRNDDATSAALRSALGLDRLNPTANTTERPASPLDSNLNALARIRAAKG